MPHQKNDWNSAQNVCKTQGANLFNPRTKYQNNNVSNVAQDIWGNYNPFWIGINDIGKGPSINDATPKGEGRGYPQKVTRGNNPIFSRSDVTLNARISPLK